MQQRSKPRYWFISIPSKDGNSDTSLIAMDEYDVVICIMCHYLDVPYLDNIYSYIALREVFALEYSIPFSYKQNPYTLLDFIVKNGLAIVTPENQVPDIGQARAKVITITFTKTGKQTYSNSLSGVYDAIRLYLYPSVRPTDAMFLLHLSGEIGDNLSGLSKLDVVDRLIISSYITLEGGDAKSSNT